MICPEQLVLTAILLCIGGAVLTLLASPNKTVAGWLAFLVTTASAILVMRAVWTVLVRGASAHAAEFWSMPYLGFALRLYVDGLTALFLLLAALIAVPASLYSIAYMRHYREYGVARFYPHFLLFSAAMYGLLSTTDMMWIFFILGQLMLLSGAALVGFEYKHRDHVRSAARFLLWMEIGCLAVMLGTKLLTAGGSALPYDFDPISAGLPRLFSASPGLAFLAYALFLVGFGIMAGMWPFGQLWLPDAHASAPAPFSALLSGVMIKLGVYRLLRYFLWLVPATQSHYPLFAWGTIVTALGTITLFAGTGQALKQEQSKRLLAFHSIGQVGYIMLGAGMCMMLSATGVAGARAVAALAIFGALLHVINHGIFKALLAFNAGSLLHATGTQDLNKMGGLLRYMPITGMTAMVASFSIAGIPLFNGFVSKWTLYLAAIHGGMYVRWLPLCAAIAILTSAVTLASFIKFFGASFLSRTSTLVRTRAQQNGKLEVPWTMRVPQVALAFLCVLLGMFPALGLGLLQRAMASNSGSLGAVLAEALPVTVGATSGVADITRTALFAPMALAAVLALAFLLSIGISQLGGARRRAAAPWLCGYAREAECNRYVAHNFYGEIKRYFAGGIRHIS